MPPSHLTLSDLERSKSRSLSFKALYLVKELRPYVVTIKNTNKKPHIWGVLHANGIFTFDHERSKSGSLRF